MSLTARAVFFAVMAGACLVACDDAPPPKKAAEAAPGGKPRILEAALPPQMVAAVSSGKTATMISVHFALQAPPTVGKPLPVDIIIVPHRPFTSVHAFFEAPESLALTEGKQFDPQKDLKPEAMLKHKLALQPSAEGVFLITAAVETEGEDGSVTRIYSIPVIVHAETPAGKPGA